MVKYHDSIKQADKKMAMSVKQLHAWGLASNPINYAVSYEYISEKNTSLIAAIHYQLSSGGKLDTFYIEEVYQQFVLGQSKFRDDLISDLDGLLSTAQYSNKQSTTSVNSLLSILDKNLDDIQSSDTEKVKTAFSQINQASKAFKTQIHALNEELLQYRQQSKHLQLELTDIRKNIYLDPLTGLYNRKAMSKHLEQWFKEDPHKEIAAIVININQFSQVTDKFGSLISDVLLTKVADKVGSYVDDSGLPVRLAGDAFLILLPELDRDITQEIADKIKQGVEKLRFISSKSGIRLPQLTISTGVNHFIVSENVNTVINRTRSIITEMHKKASNQILRTREAT
ncbi:MAG: diguanylate cyclase [Alteromonadaceae bacterium]|jgi:diguanylate cyclase